MPSGRRLRSPTGRPVSRSATAAWADSVRQLKPNVVAFLAGGGEVLDREFDAIADILDPAFAAYVKSDWRRRFGSPPPGRPHGSRRPTMPSTANSSTGNRGRQLRPPGCLQLPPPPGRRPAPKPGLHPGASTPTSAPVASTPPGSERRASTPQMGRNTISSTRSPASVVITWHRPSSPLGRLSAISRKHRPMGPASGPGALPVLFPQ